MKNILLIEDNLEVRENTAEILELAKYNVVTAENGRIGVELAKTSMPDLIICDIMMPELDGYGVLHILSKTPETASIPFIFLTAKAEKEEVRKGMNMGADDYLTKPFDDVELLNAIESRLQRHERILSVFMRDSNGLVQFYNEARGIEELRHLSGEKEIKSFRKKDIIYEEGNSPRFLLFIRSGKVKCFKTNPDGKEFITGLHREGEFFGYQGILEDSKYSDSSVALEDCALTLIPKADFFDLIYKDKDVSTKFIRMLSNDLKEQEQRLMELAYNSVRKRVADSLLLLHEKYAEGKDTVPLSITISREDLANIVGTAKESVIRVLSDFKEENILETKSSTITILDLVKLRKMKN